MSFLDIGYNQFLQRLSMETGQHFSAYGFDSALEGGAIDSTQLARFIIDNKHLRNEIINNANITYNPRAYNAIVDMEGNGTHGNIQTAIDYVHTIGGGVILIKRGTFIIYDDINLYSNIQLIGEDRYTTILDFNNTAYKINVKKNTQNITIKGLQFKARKGSAGGVISLSGVNGLIIENNYFNGNSFGYDIDSLAGNNDNVLIKENYGINGSTFFHDTLGNSVNLSIVFNNINTYSGRFLHFISGIVNITNNICSDITTDVILFEDPFTGILSNNFFEVIRGNGIQLAAVESAVVSNNLIYGINSGSGIGIYLTGGGADTVISNNSIASMGSDGIKLINAGRNVINSNTFYSNNGYGINISNSGCLNNIVTSNSLYDNTLGGLNDVGTTTTVANNVTS